MAGTFELIAPPHAPFHADGSLNLSLVEHLAEHFVRSGIAGVFVSGTTGESLSLTVPERLNLAKRWIDVCCETDIDVIIQVGHNCVEDARQMAEHAQSEGADAIATMAPSFLKPATVQDLIDCCIPVAQAAGDLPFYLYDIPVMTDVRLPMPEFLAKARQQIPNLKGLKFTNPDLVQLQECLHLGSNGTGPGEFEILFGCDEILLAGAMLGCPGAVGSTYNFAAAHYRAMIDSFEVGDMQAARTGQHEAVRMIRTLQKYSFLPAAKAVMSFLGIDCGPVRAPIGNLSSAQKSLLRAELQSLPAFAGANLDPAEVR
ncbi:MAG: dihydrodipicolinate synthase family protein [Planctomycetota bacterium]|nr:dihydrodipicolinate synthase family protein [Planctomycetota bacterium]MDA1164924.1 dihydrodipicolinate synthase family protein [Planctomycetota bacterium]